MFYFLLNTQPLLVYSGNMSSTVIEVDYIEQVQLHHQANYWRAQHARAIKRETLWKAKVQELEMILRQRDTVITELRQQIVQKDGTIAKRDQQIEALKAKLIWLQQQLFGRKTEQTENESCDSAVEQKRFQGTCYRAANCKPREGGNSIAKISALFL